jgi:hypothetical protein
MYYFLRGNQRGSAFIFALIVAAAVGVGITFYMSTQDNMQKSIRVLNSQKDSLIGIDKMRTIANYLISSNMVICKQGAFTGSTDTYRCRWTGLQLINGTLQTILPQKLGLDEGSFDEQGFLVFNVDSSIINDSDSNGAQAIKFKGKIGLKLYDAFTDSLQLSESLGKIPLKVLKSDNDRAFVLIKVIVEVQNSSVGSAENKNKEIIEYFSTRRPIAIPKVTVNVATCKRSCEVSVGKNDNPACRGDQNYTYTPSVPVSATTVNLGPGVLYEMQVQKDIKLDQTLFPGVFPAPSVVNAMPGKDYLMPMEKVTWTDTVTCYSRNETIKRQLMVSQATGKCWWSDEPQSSWSVEKCNAEESQENQHFVNSGTITYNIDVSPIKLDQVEQFIASFMSSNGSDKISMNYVIPANYKNTSLSKMEPARSVRLIVTDSTFQTKVDTTTEIQEIPTH